jgi:hypothetical protein
MQLWNQPSVRMLGFGRYFAGYIPDPITDLTWNPAYLKTFGEDTASYNTAQIYGMARAFNSNDLSNETAGMQFYESEELVSIYALWPKIGLAWRLGAWQRRDIRDYNNVELWPYGQAGMMGCVGITRYVKVGLEYSGSWNNQPDWISRIKMDSLGIPYDAEFSHLERSDQVGLGILLTDNVQWELSLSGKKNWEVDSFKADTAEYWRQNEQIVFEDRYDDIQLNARFKFALRKLVVLLSLKYFRKDYIQSFDIDWDSYRTAIRPGLGIVYYVNKDVLVLAALDYGVNKAGTQAYLGTESRQLMGLAGFEARLSPLIIFRVGNTLTYTYYAETYHSFKNEISFGIDLRPYEKLTFYFATNDPLEYSQWYFGISFAL